jgi:hypothetical protein
MDTVHRAVLTAFDILTEGTEIYDMYIAMQDLFRHVDDLEMLEMTCIVQRRDTWMQFTSNVSIHRQVTQDKWSHRQAGTWP